MKKVAFLLLLVIFIAKHGLCGPLANPSLDPGQAMGQRARPSASAESAERMAPGGARARQKDVALGGGAKPARGGSSGAGSRSSPRPEAVDPLVLLVSKTYASGNWQLELDWSGATSPYTVSYSQDPSFQTGAQTLALDYTGTSYGQPATAGSSLECFEVTDASVVSLPAQTLGYDPVPPPVTPQFADLEYWWGSELILNSGYLDPIAKENLVHFYDRPVRPDSVSGVSGSFASSLKVDHIPNDTRSFWTIVESRGTGSSYVDAPYLNLYAKNISLPDITSLTWAPCEGSPDTGNVFVAASGGIWEVNLFLRTPALTPRDTGTKMYLSRPTNMTNPAATHQILYVDGVSGVTEVKQIDACTGAITTFAQTSDSQFTSAIWPRGIAVDQDGAYCYIADANGSRIVRIPAGNSGNIIASWGNRTFGLNDPTGMDVGLNGRLWLTESNGRLWQIITQTYPYSMGWVEAGANCLDIDKDVSTSSNTIFVWDTTPFTDAYNRNGIEDVALTPTRYHGGTVFGQADGKLRLDQMWVYSFSRHFPQRVLLSRQGQTIPFPSIYQYTDRIIELRVRGWPGMATQLRVIDPPDFAAYAQDGGWCGTSGFPACTAAPPYEGNDNLGMSDYGLTIDPTGAGASNTLKVYPLSNYYALAYLKVPANVSGNNFQVEATKCKADGTVLDKKIPNLSPVFTTWKRVYVERDKMFRRGGLLYDDAMIGDSAVVLYKNPDDTCWDNISSGDKIAIFDKDTPFEGPHDEAYVDTINDQYGSSTPHQVLVTLVTTSGGSTAYQLTHSYSHSPVGAGYVPDFTQGSSAGAGVVYSTVPIGSGSFTRTVTDISSNQLNSLVSAFFDADMHGIKQPFDDANVELVGLPAGMGAVPYISDSIGFYLGDVNSANMRLSFQDQWALQPHTPNNIYLTGCAGPSVSAFGVPVIAGISDWSNHNSFCYTNTLETLGVLQSNTPQEIIWMIQTDTSHELAHNFRANRCSIIRDCSKQSEEGHHDFRPWWNCGTAGCPDPNPNPCLMQPSIKRYPDGIDRFCKEDLLLGDPKCGTLGDGALRTLQDPLP
jgi:hypothetical protein